VAKPFEAEADPRRVDDIIAGLQDARVVKEVTGADADLASFGLAPPVCRVELSVGQEPAPRVLRLGRASPVGADRYAVDPSGRVVLSDGSLFGLFSRDAEALRERRLVPLAAESVTRIAIERPAGKLVLEAKDGTWTIVAPIRDAASSSACRDLARAVVSIELDDAHPTAAPIASRPDRRIAIEVGASGASTNIVAYVATAGIEGKRVGWRDGGGLTGLLQESAARELEHAPDAYRDKRVTDFSTPDALWVTVERPGHALRVERAAEGAAWSGRDGDATFVPDAARVEALLARLRTLTATGFDAADGAPATGTIGVGGAAGELARLTWGPAPQGADADGETLRVTTPARPGVVFRVRAADLGPIPAAPADWTAAR